MKLIFALFDSLNRNALTCYGGTHVKTPNFQRLADRAVVFDSHYVGSLPCIPARRDMHTGRLNFLHRSWGPLEPYDNSFPVMLREQNIHTHLASDHYHYFEDGGWSYHNRYSTWEFVRGQESDHWAAMVKPPLERLREKYHPLNYESTSGSVKLQGMLNREWIREEKDFPCVKTFDLGLRFLDNNRTEDGWLLQVETFDPHEPFQAPERFRQDYPTNYAGGILDWPHYRRVVESPDEVAELRANYAALVALCDAQLGRLLDYMDEHAMWDDTALVLTTDHGFLLGEHDWWAKNVMPFYNQIANIPLLIYHPDFKGEGGTRRIALTQTIDIMPTLLDIFDVEVPVEVRGHSLMPLMNRDEAIREIGLYGMFGAATNATDGRYTYFRYPDDIASQELFEYTLMPTHMRDFFQAEEFEGAALTEPFDFTKGMPTLRLPARLEAERPGSSDSIHDVETVLYDLETDPEQHNHIDPGTVPDVMERLLAGIRSEMQAHDAPPEAFARLDLAG